MEKERRKFAKVFLIAGSEPLGSAGIQADIKAVSACGGYAAGAVTCIVDEDTRKVKSVFTVPVKMIQDQAYSFLDDVKADCIKTGMLYSVELIHGVEEILLKYPHILKVIDPVMVSSAGDPLLEASAIQAYKERLFPLADIITPNAQEAAILLGHPFTAASPKENMEKLTQWGNKAVVVKSVETSSDELTDYYYEAGTQVFKTFTKPKVPTHNVNGSGDSFASAITTFMARGFTTEKAVEQAEDFIHKAIESGAQYTFGSGYGPVNPFYHITDAL